MKSNKEGSVVSSERISKDRENFLNEAAVCTEEKKRVINESDEWPYYI